VIVLIAAGAVVAGGAVAQGWGEARDRRRFPPPGRMVDVDGVRLHVVVEGSGPVVLIDSGLGGSSLEWQEVAAGLRGSATVVRYDRPGFGWSPAARTDRSPQASAERIRLLLGALGVTEPVVLVGHSLGGLHVRLLAQLHPELVRGLVLVDPSHEDMLDAAPVPLSARVTEHALGVSAALARLGTPRLLGRLYSKAVAAQLRRPLDDSTRTAMHTSTLLTSCSVKGFRAAAAELRCLRTSLRQVQLLNAQHPVPPVPLTVITAAAPGRTPAEQRGRDVIDALHRRQADASPLGRQVLARSSGHLVPLDEPALVVDCVREVLAATEVAS
jgi:pimeloyl-ACP methyl ester carboxylesterase